jgi:hypothetical protein
MRVSKKTPCPTCGVARHTALVLVEHLAVAPRVVGECLVDLAVLEPLVEVVGASDSGFLACGYSSRQMPNKALHFNGPAD